MRASVFNAQGAGTLCIKKVKLYFGIRAEVSRMITFWGTISR